MLHLDNGKDDEAAALVDHVRKTAPADRRLMATLVQALDMLGKGEKMLIDCLLMIESDIFALYEEISRKNPKDEELGKYWFQQMIFRTNIDGARKVFLSYIAANLRLQWH